MSRLPKILVPGMDKLFPATRELLVSGIGNLLPELFPATRHYWYREHSLPAPIYKYIGNGRAPTHSVGATRERPTHGREPTQTKRAGEEEM